MFTPDEIDTAIRELQDAGLSDEDILTGGLAGALRLAAAGALGVGDAVGIAAHAKEAFAL